MRHAKTAALLLALAALPAGAVEVQLLSRIPPRLAPETGSGGSLGDALSADGRFVVFTSAAENLVPGVADRNRGLDVFLYDRQTGETGLVSRSAGEEPATGDLESRDPAISADGRFVTFWSSATDLVPGQAEDEIRTDVFLWDRVTGTMELVSHAAGSRTLAANGASSQPAISADGRSVVFTSQATDLTRGVADHNATFDVFLYDRRTGAVSLVSRASASPREAAGAQSSDPAISADGRRVVFLSAAVNLVPGQVDTNQSQDVFLWDRATGRISLVSRSAGNPAVAGNQDNFLSPLISADGAYVAFGSRATNLVPGQGGTGNNLFLWERATGKVTLVTHAASSPTQGAGDSSNLGALSADGSWLLYSATGRSLVPGQRDHPSQPTLDVFLWSRQTGQSRLLSGRGGSASRTGNNSSFAGGLSADGSWAVFASLADDLLPGVTDNNSGRSDVFLWSRRSGRTTLLSHAAGSPGTTAEGDSGAPRISADGRWIAYTSAAPDLDAGTRDTNSTGDVILESRGGDREIVTLHARGLASVTPTGPSAAQSIDASGRFIVFRSDARELFPNPEAWDGGTGVFLYDRATRARTLLSGDRPCHDGRISADGRFVAFACGGAVFLWNRETAATTLLAERDGSSASDLAISADGSVVAFVSVSPVVVTIFVWDRATGTGSPVAGDRQALGLSLDASGRVVAFHSPATDLVTGVADANGQPDVFVLDRTTGTTTLVSRAVDGAEAVGGVAPRVSADGRFVAFTSESTRLVAGQMDFPGTSDLFLYDRATGTTRLVSHEIQGAAFAAGGVLAGQADLDATGRFVAFASTATNLTFQQADSNGVADVFLFDREGGPTELVSRTQSAASFTANSGSGEPRLSADGRILVFLSTATDLAGEPGDPGSMNLFLYDRSANTLVSRSFASPLRRSNGPASNPVLAASGSAVAFTSFASDLVPRDFNFQADAFVAELP